MLLITVLNLSGFSNADDNFIVNTDQQLYPYLAHKPLKPESDSNWPVLVFLHGQGARYSTIDQVAGNAKMEGFGKVLSQYYSQPDEASTLLAEKFFTLLPVSPNAINAIDIYHWRPIELQTLINQITVEHNLDRNRIYISGYSMGGRGTARAISFLPGYFAAAAMIAGIERQGECRYLYRELDTACIS